MITISFYGGMGVGKDYLSNQLLEHYAGHRTQWYALADPLKFAASRRHGFTFDQLYVGNKPEAVRRALTLDVDLHKSFDAIAHLRHALYTAQMRGVELFVISDLRMMNEVYAIAALDDSLIVHVKAPRRNWKRALAEAGGDVEKANLALSHRTETIVDLSQDLQHIVLVNDDDTPCDLLQPVFDFVTPRIQTR